MLSTNIVTIFLSLNDSSKNVSDRAFRLENAELLLLKICLPGSMLVFKIRTFWGFFEQFPFFASYILSSSFGSHVYQSVPGIGNRSGFTNRRRQTFRKLQIFCLRSSQRFVVPLWRSPNSFRRRAISQVLRAETDF